MNNLAVCFTGHRELPKKELKKITKRLEKEVEKLIKNGCRLFAAGGALGFDTLAAVTVLRLKTKYPDIRLILVLPCETQAKSWSNEDKAIYEDIKSRADKIIYTSKNYYRGCMHKRNRQLVDISGICVCYLARNVGGTAYTVNYALSKGLKIINISRLADFGKNNLKPIRSEE